MMLTEHFSLRELTHSDTAIARKINNTPSADQVEELRVTAQLLERIRAHLGNKPIIVSSGFRTPALTKAVGGSTTSDHDKAMATDFSCPKFGTPFQVATELAKHCDELGIGQLIYESLAGKTWVHVSTRIPSKPINRIITINDRGTFAGIVK